MENAVRLAVARLAESGEAACGCRLRAERAVEGYCLVAGDRLTMYVENARRLSERSVDGLFYYEGWVLTGDGPVSLGVFNTEVAGEATATCVAEAGLLERAVGMRVTAEPHGGSIAGHRPVLDGRLIWLQQPEREPVADPVISHGLDSTLELAAEVGEPAIEPAVEPLPDAHWHPAYQAAFARGGLPWSELLSRAGAGAGAGAQSEPQSETQVETQPESQSESQVAARVETQVAAQVETQVEAQVETQVEAQVETQVEAQVETQASPPPEAESTPSRPTAPEHAPPGINLYPEPATMVTTVVPVTRNVALSSVHPMAPRAVGAAVVRLREGQVTLTLRGLPAPPALGRDPATDRPFNTYRVWLLNQRTGQGTALGICERLWGESYRFQSEPGLVLSRHDTLLVTAGDRSEIEPNAHGARILLGTFQGA